MTDKYNEDEAVGETRATRDGVYIWHLFWGFGGGRGNTLFRPENISRSRACAEFDRMELCKAAARCMSKIYYRNNSRVYDTYCGGINKMK